MTAQLRPETALEVFATCPQSKDYNSADYAKHAVTVARWSEAAGCTGILIYTDNGLADPWLVGQTIIQATNTLCPLVALQPIYMHPYTAAKMVSTIAHLHGRRVYLNMVAGGFRGDLQALGDTSPHDDRYLRLTEYTLIVKSLLAGGKPVTFDGQYYAVKNLRLAPSLPAEFMPSILMSGSSPAALAAVRQTGAVGIVYPEPFAQNFDPLQTVLSRGARFGVIARADADQAWQIARARFPADGRGRMTHKLAMAVSDSVWHKQLSLTPDQPEGGQTPYWLWPFHSYKTFCPYLVGSHEQVAAYLGHYIACGYRTFILDIPRAPEDLENARITFDMAIAQQSDPAAKTEIGRSV